MSLRKIISIDQALCNGCGLCIPNCPEGALQVIDGKARLVSDLSCDGLGACIGYCPEGAISLEEREAEPYDEAAVMRNIAPQGVNTIRAHLEHLKAHGEAVFLRQAVEFLEGCGIPVPDGFARKPAPMEVKAAASHGVSHQGCPGARVVEMESPDSVQAPGVPQPSRLGNWPVQLHLISPTAPQFAGKDVLLCADCVAYAMGAFHETLLKGKALVIACPKLDEGTDIYREKITALIDHAGITSLTVAMMEVPCCRGLLSIAEQAVAHSRAAREGSGRKVPLKALIVGIRGGDITSL
jgi:ferredoxin